MARNTLDILNISAVDDVANIIDCMAEVKLNENLPGVFLRIKETLGRIGVVTAQNPNVLNQTCHILCRGAKYYIVHFKHLYVLDGRYNDIKREDVLRMNRIIQLLVQWDLVTLVHPEQVTELASMEKIFIVKHKDVDNYVFKTKYKIRSTKETGNNNDHYL